MHMLRDKGDMDSINMRFEQPLRLSNRFLYFGQYETGR